MLLGSESPLPAERDGGVFWVRGVEQWEAQEEARSEKRRELLRALASLNHSSELYPSCTLSLSSSPQPQHAGQRDAATSSGAANQGQKVASSTSGPGADSGHQSGTDSVFRSSEQTGDGARLAAELEESVGWYCSELAALRRCLLSLEIHNASQEMEIERAQKSTHRDQSPLPHRTWRSGPTAAAARLGAAGTAALATLGAPLAALAPAAPAPTYAAPAPLHAAHSGEGAGRGGHQEAAQLDPLAVPALVGCTSSEHRYATGAPCLAGSFSSGAKTDASRHMLSAAGTRA